MAIRETMVVVLATEKLLKSDTLSEVVASLENTADNKVLQTMIRHTEILM